MDFKFKYSNFCVYFFSNNSLFEIKSHKDIFIIKLKNAYICDKNEAI